MKLIITKIVLSRKLIAAVKNGEYDEAFRVHQEALWLITHKLAKVTVMMIMMTVMMMMIRVQQEVLWLITHKLTKVTLLACVTA